jgi:chemotaxis protein MotB
MARKKAAHHGGAWKVAYADFVTAMMALFMVLWISAQDQKIVIATSQFFQNPFRATSQPSAGVMPAAKESRSQGPESSERVKARSRQTEIQFLNTVAADFYRSLRLDQDINEKPIEIQVTTDGLRLTLFDRARKPLFVENTAEFTDWGRFVMQNLSWTIERHRFRVTIEGHTKAKLVLPRPEYTPWELSADRANASRRSLVHYAVEAELIDRVTGFADTRPLPGEATDSEANQRITLSLALSSRSRRSDDAVLDKTTPKPAS